MDAIVSPPIFDHQINTCIVYPGFCNPVTGYSQLSVGGKGGRTITGHRLMWRLMRGEIPHGMVVCHFCDNPPCININHLFLGTQKDNVHDSMRKGRRPSISLGNRSPIYGMNILKTVCKRGHPYDDANTKWYSRPNGSKVRRCGICQKTLQTQCDARRQAKRVAEREQRKAS